jgi:lipopolysaccharide transport system permease protein
MTEFKYYSSKGSFHKKSSGFISNIQTMIVEIKIFLPLAKRLFYRDLTSRYRQMILGLLWPVITPVITVMLFVILKESGIISITLNQSTPYVIFALTGINTWTFFSSVLSAVSNSLVSAGSMIVKINFPKMALILSSTGLPAIDFLIRTLLLLILCFYFGVKVSFFSFLSAILLIIPVYFFVIGIGCVLALFTVVIRDIPQITPMVMSGLMLLSPVMYPLKSDSSLFIISKYNPVAIIIEYQRLLLFNQSGVEINTVIILILLSLFVFFIGWRILFVAQTKITERL